MKTASVSAHRAGAQPFKAQHGRQHASRAPAVQAILGGSSNDRQRSDDRNRLILPGRQQEPAGGRRSLVLPGQKGNSGSAARPGGGGGGGGGGLVAGPGMPPPTQNFRPPPGFMDAEGPAVEETGMSVDEMLNRVRSQSGPWHQLAKLIPALQRKGVDGLAVEEDTGLERRQQNIWATAAQVYESIKGVVSPEALAHFDVEGEDLLYELRFLSIKQRAPAAAYIAAQNLSPQESQVLARAIKEYERRNGKQEGFADSPGDVLAYKFYRDAQESRRKDDIETLAKKALAVADTDSARAKLSEMLEGNTAGALALPTATLTMLRLTRDEVGFRPMAVAGELQSATVDQVMAAPKVSSEGVFGNFRVPANGVQHEWVGLPNWSLLQLAVHPVALMIQDCAAVAAVVASSSAKTEDELKRMSGLGVLVVDIAAETAALKPDCYYLATDDSGKMRLMAGGEAEAAARVLGPVLFLCRPPSRETPAATTSELLSM